MDPDVDNPSSEIVTTLAASAMNIWIAGAYWLQWCCFDVGVFFRRVWVLDTVYNLEDDLLQRVDTVQSKLIRGPKSDRLEAGLDPLP